MASWRREHRPEGIQWVREMDFLIKERNEKDVIVHRVSDEGRQFVTLPSFEPITMSSPPSPTDMEAFVYHFALPDDEDELALVNWAINCYRRNGKWPTPNHYNSSGIYQRDAALFWEVFNRLIDDGRLARIHVRRGKRKVTRLVYTRYCPQFAGKDGYIYFWSTVQGPFPEP